MRELKLTRPIVFFDLETTGLDFQNDRIIEIGAIRIEADGREVIPPVSMLVNPGMHIPSEITELTGIADSDVAGKPTFEVEAKWLMKLFDGADLGGYSIGRFDSKFIAAEFARCGHDFDLGRRRIVDARVIYHKMFPRDLAAALMQYCGTKTDGKNHRAMFDTEASMRILHAQLQAHPELPEDIDGLAAYCAEDSGKNVDSEGKLYWRDGKAAFNFGKHRSKTLDWCVHADPNYLNWILKSSKDFAPDFIAIVKAALDLPPRYPKKLMKEKATS
jgi:DNA polymerase III subunit epsilon